MVAIDWVESWAAVKPLALFILGMVFYTIFVFRFYRFLASKDIFKLDLGKYNKARFGFFKKLVSFFFYMLKNVVIFPICVFFWFIVLVVLLAFLSRNQTMDSILLVAMALVGTVRVTAYYNEELSKDVAKMLPFALLGVYLVDVSFFSFDTSVNLIMDLPSYWQTLWMYLGFVILLELVLSAIHGITSWFSEKSQP